MLPTALCIRNRKGFYPKSREVLLPECGSQLPGAPSLRLLQEWGFSDRPSPPFLMSLVYLHPLKPRKDGASAQPVHQKHSGEAMIRLPIVLFSVLVKAAPHPTGHESRITGRGTRATEHGPLSSAPRRPPLLLPSAAFRAAP